MSIVARATRLASEYADVARQSVVSSHDASLRFVGLPTTACKGRPDLSASLSKDGTNAVAAFDPNRGLDILGQMKGAAPAGGFGTRLLFLTKIANKPLFAVNDPRMICSSIEKLRFRS
jgi:hypothetical protein